MIPPASQPFSSPSARFARIAPTARMFGSFVSATLEIRVGRTLFPPRYWHPANGNTGDVYLYAPSITAFSPCSVQSTLAKTVLPSSPSVKL